MLNYYYNKKLITNADVFPYIKGVHLKMLPLPNLNKDGERKLAYLVDTVIQSKKEELDTLMVENKIDLMVYHLYGLTYDEVLIVDPQTPITREEYEKD